ncbi:hypothetical protein M405DRAFT_28164 [Rhizopogon salebrosus TDB-379]|nr:hypothetical protein M405DRAFT_28164 [Rhizopogon salebrosus TDB-379]
MHSFILRNNHLRNFFSLNGFCVRVPRPAYHPIIPFHGSSFTMDNLQVSNRFSVSFPRSPVSTVRVTKHPHPDVLLFIIHFLPAFISRSYRRAGAFLTLLRASICRPHAHIALLSYTMPLEPRVADARRSWPR